MATSWGKFQILGANHRACGFKTVQEYVDAMHVSEFEHLKALVNFLQHTGIVNDLRQKNWKQVARKYNGPAYARNQYDIKLERSYKKHQISVQKIQSALTKLGYNPGPIDNLFGPKTSKAIAQFESDNTLPITGSMQPSFINAIKSHF